MTIDPKDLAKHFNMGHTSKKKTGTIAEKKKTGTIADLKEERHFGFISVPGEKNNLFFHFNNLVDRSQKHNLWKGAKVSFQVEKGRDGRPAAMNVEMLDAPKQTLAKKTLLFQQGKSDDYYLPDDTRKAIKTLLASQEIDNFSLLLNKCALYDGEQEKFILTRAENQKKRISAYHIQPDFNPIPLVEILARHKHTINNLDLDVVEPEPFTVDWRLIVGLGNESVYETSMTLHHIYGIPYLPAQAVKGMVRSWLLLEKFGEYEKPEKKALEKSPVFCDLFGCPKDSVYREARQGKIYFFDAFPTNLTNDSIQPDIMNPHYGPYYSDGKPPADYHEPRPVTFLTVNDTAFQFYIGIRKKEEAATQDDFFKEDMSLLNRAKDALVEALTLHGIGAKTAVGYGYFSGTEVT